MMIENNKNPGMNIRLIAPPELEISQDGYQDNPDRNLMIVYRIDKIKTWLLRVPRSRYRLALKCF